MSTNIGPHGTRCVFYISPISIRVPKASKDLYRAGLDIEAYERSANAFLEAVTKAELAWLRAERERDERLLRACLRVGRNHMNDRDL